MFSDKISTVIWITLPVFVMCHFPLVIFKTLKKSLISCKFIIIYGGIIFFEFNLSGVFWAFWIYKFISFTKSGKFSAILFPLFIFFCDSNDINVNLLIFSYRLVPPPSTTSIFPFSSSGLNSFCWSVLIFWLFPFFFFYLPWDHLVNFVFQIFFRSKISSYSPPPPVSLS